MVEQGEFRKLSIGASLAVWFVAAVVGWAALAGIGYSVYHVGENVIAGWSAPDAEAPAVKTAAPSDREIRELQKIAPAAGGTRSGQ